MKAHVGRDHHQQHLTCAGSLLGCGCSRTDELFQVNGTHTLNSPPSLSLQQKGWLMSRRRRLLLPFLGTTAWTNSSLQNGTGTAHALLWATEPLLMVMGDLTRDHPVPLEPPHEEAGPQCHCPTPAWCWPEANPSWLELQQRGRKQRDEDSDENRTVKRRILQRKYHVGEYLMHNQQAATSVVLLML